MKLSVRSTVMILTMICVVIGGLFASFGVAGAQTGTSLATTFTSQGIPTPPAATDTSAPQPPAGPRGDPLGPDADKGSQDGAARRLNEAYNEIARYQQLIGNGTSSKEAASFASNATAFYTQALNAYNAKTYAKASYLAEASKKITGAARHAIQAERGAITASGIPTPPARSTSDNSQDAAARELNHAYEKIGQVQALKATDQTVLGLQASAENLYKAASSDYAANKYESARERAQAAHDGADAALQYAQALASQN